MGGAGLEGGLFLREQRPGDEGVLSLARHQGLEVRDPGPRRRGLRHRCASTSSAVVTRLMTGMIPLMMSAVARWCPMKSERAGRLADGVLHVYDDQGRLADQIPLAHVLASRLRRRLLVRDCGAYRGTAPGGGATAPPPGAVRPALRSLRGGLFRRRRVTAPRVGVVAAPTAQPPSPLSIFQAKYAPTPTRMSSMMKMIFFKKGPSSRSLLSRGSRQGHVDRPERGMQAETVNGEPPTVPIVPHAPWSMPADLPAGRGGGLWRRRGRGVGSAHAGHDTRPRRPRHRRRPGWALVAARHRRHRRPPAHGPHPALGLHRLPPPRRVRLVRFIASFAAFWLAWLALGYPWWIAFMGLSRAPRTGTCSSGSCAGRRAASTSPPLGNLPHGRSGPVRGIGIQVVIMVVSVAVVLALAP